MPGLDSSEGEHSLGKIFFKGVTFDSEALVRNLQTTGKNLLWKTAYKKICL